jgi:hypothetical protein
LHTLEDDRFAERSPELSTKREERSGITVKEMEKAEQATAKSLRENYEDDDHNAARYFSV